uniref:Uncharacterized protein n=1 Tax=Rhizophora mucronata TaxID=61149 RepID=A0A2P2J3L3_RHIMU
MVSLNGNSWGKAATAASTRLLSRAAVLPSRNHRRDLKLVRKLITRSKSCPRFKAQDW